MRLGSLAGVVREALLGAWELACEGSALAGCRLEIEEVPVVVRCETCHANRPARSIQDLSCEVCGTPAAQVSGRELEVISLELLDA